MPILNLCQTYGIREFPQECDYSRLMYTDNHLCTLLYTKAVSLKEIAASAAASFGYYFLTKLEKSWLLYHFCNYT